MNCSQITSRIPKALPFLSLSPRLPLLSTPRFCRTPVPKFQVLATILDKPSNGHSQMKKSCLAVQIGALLATVGEPALGVTGVNNEQDLTSILIQGGIMAFFYFIVMPPIIMNWLRIRWYRRNLLEMYFQFMFVFLFFPGVLVWAPFLNFRKFPRDPSMKYPWSTPKDYSQIKNAYYKYPYAEPEDYE